MITTTALQDRMRRALRALSVEQLDDLRRFAAGEQLDLEASGQRLRQTVGLLVLLAMAGNGDSMPAVVDRVRSWIDSATAMQGASLQDLVAGALLGA